MYIGHFFANNIFKANIKITSVILLISILLRTFEVNYLHTNSLQALIAIVLFVFALNLNVTIKDETSLKVRKLSTPCTCFISYSFCYSISICEEVLSLISQ